MLNLGDSTYEAERWKDELARVEAGRLTRPVERRPARVGVSWQLWAGRLLTALGQRLVGLGCALETRYAARCSVNPSLQ